MRQPLPGLGTAARRPAGSASSASLTPSHALRPQTSDGPPAPPTLSRVTMRRRLTLASLALASVFCVGLVVARRVYTHDAFYDFMAWNLVLAWIPLALALAAYDG